MNLRSRKGGLLSFLLNTESLNDLMSIINDICNSLNPSHKDLRFSYKGLYFTLLVLNIRARGFLELINFRIEQASRSIKGLDGFKFKIGLFLRNVNIIHKLIKTNKLIEAVNKLEQLSSDYLTIYNKAGPLIKNKLLGA